MKATKKIVGAACALVAAVALSAGSTFAWFTTSAKVTSEGMDVKAVVPSTLMINPSFASWSESDTVSTKVASSDPKWSSLGITYNEGTGAHSLSPYNLTASGAELTVKHGTASSSDSSTASGSLTQDITGVKIDNYTEATTKLTDYAACYPLSLYLQTSDAGSKDIVAKVVASQSSITTGDKTLEFLHVGFLTDTAWSSSYTNYADATISGTSVTFSSVSVTTLSPSTATKVLMVVWFEGEDSSCFNNNALSVHDITLSIEFSFATT